LTEEAAPTPFELVRWNMAKQYGWTLEYIDGLDLATLAEHTQIVDGTNKAMASRRVMGR